MRLRLLTDVDVRRPARADGVRAADPRRGAATIAKLGPDPLVDDVAEGEERFTAVVRRKPTPIGLLLMDQSVVSGIGNVYRAELLFRARSEPAHARAATCREDVVRELWRDWVRLLRDRRRDRSDDDDGRPRSGGVSRARWRTATTVTGSTTARGCPCRVCGTAIVRRGDGDAQALLVPEVPGVTLVVSSLHAPEPELRDDRRRGTASPHRRGIPGRPSSAAPPDGLVASHYAVLLDEDRDDLTIVGHVGKPDDMIHGLGERELLVVVQGPHGYISPGWYGDVRVRADVELRLRAPDAACRRSSRPEENLRVLDRLVAHFEGRMPEPRLMWERPNDPTYVERLERGTVGFRLTPTRVVAKRKLSQNKSADVVETVIARAER